MRIQLQDFGMEYVDSGVGRPLVCVHGYPLNHKMWEPQLRGLSAEARVLAPDLRGHGRSDAPAGPYSMDLLADDLRQFLDAQRITQPIVLCGLSMGGYVAFAFCRKYSDRLAGLILAATRAGADSPEGRANRDKAIALAEAQGVSAIVDSMLPKMLSPKAYESQADLVQQVRAIMEATSLNGVKGALAGMRDRPDCTPTLAQIDKPTLILHGADDQLIPPTEAEAMRAGIRNARLEIIPQAGHLPNLEQPAAFNGAVRAFLAEGVK